MEELIWSVQRHSQPDAAMRLLALVPGLLKGLRDGLSSAAFDPFATSEFFSQLEALHLDLFEQQAEASVAVIDAARSPLVKVEQEIVLPSAEEGPLEAAPLALAATDPGVLQVDQLRLGAWVEFLEDDDINVRCKLAAIVEQPVAKYIFVNRTGMKVLERTRMGLALEFQRGAVRTLDDTLLFDRALESVIGTLQRLNRGK